MRIGIDAHAAEEDGSGNCTYIRNLLTALAALDDGENEYFLYVRDPEHPFFIGWERPANFHLRRLRLKAPVLRIPVGLALASRRDKLDVLHVQFIGPPLHRGKLVATIHDLGFLHVPRTFPRLFVWRSRILIRRTARRAARIITGSALSRDDLVTTYGLAAARIALIPYGVAPGYFAPRDPAETDRVLAQYGIRRPYILTVSRINPRKNLVLLAAAFRRFQESMQGRRQLVVVGKPDYDSTRTMTAIEAAVAAVSAENEADLAATGYVPDEDLRHIYGAAETFVYISLFEGVGLPVFEAMASGVPVVTSASSSMAEIAAGAAVLVDPRNEEELACALIRLAQDRPYRAERIEIGRRRAAQLSWPEAARRTLEVYRAACR